MCGGLDDCAASVDETVPQNGSDAAKTAADLSSSRLFMTFFPFEFFAFSNRWADEMMASRRLERVSEQQNFGIAENLAGEVQCRR